MPRWAANLDMYRKVPGDLLEGTRQGSIISLLALMMIATLFWMETKAFLTPTLQTDLALDRSAETKIEVMFNITLMDLKCEYATIDVVSVLGKQQNVSQHVQKWTVDAQGVQQQFLHRNMMQHDIELFDKTITSSIEDLHDDGEDAVSLDETTLEFALNEHSFVFVDFYASWCSHCRDLAPTWETLAEIIVDAGAQVVEDHKLPQLGEYSEEDYKAALKVHLPVLVAKIDCVDHHDLCMRQGIAGYPTLRLFINGKQYEGGDYWGHRTILGMTEYLALAEEKHKDEYQRGMDRAAPILEQRLNVSADERMWAEALERTRHSMQLKWNPDEHPGCQLSGILLMDRAPGHFHIQARSQAHEIAPHMTNVSHIINNLSFGKPGFSGFVDVVELGRPSDPKVTPMNGYAYVTKELHEAYHHYIKLVSTNLMSYRVLESSQLAYYRNDMVPEAKFIVDLSPISVSYHMTTRRWYDYITSLMAIIGGTFTVVGMLEAGLRQATRRTKGMR